MLISSVSCNARSDLTGGAPYPLGFGLTGGGGGRLLLLLGLLVARTGVWKLGCALSLLGGSGGRLYTGDGRFDGGGGGPGCRFSVEEELQINQSQCCQVQISPDCQTRF